MSVSVTLVFFFQAEDGIRDSSVTGVQTCALPISSGIHVGAAVSIQQLIDFATDVVGRRSADQTTGLKALTRHAVFIAAHQVRCAGSVAGNDFMTPDHSDHGAPFPPDIFTIYTTLC